MDKSYKIVLVYPNGSRRTVYTTANSTKAHLVYASYRSQIAQKKLKAESHDT